MKVLNYYVLLCKTYIERNAANTGMHQYNNNNNNNNALYIYHILLNKYSLLVYLEITVH